MNFLEARVAEVADGAQRRLQPVRGRILRVVVDDQDAGVRQNAAHGVRRRRIDQGPYALALLDVFESSVSSVPPVLIR